MSSSIEKKEDSLGLWLNLVNNISNHGEKIVNYYEEVPEEIFETFHLVLLNLAKVIISLNDRNRLTMWNWVRIHNPELLDNFQAHFDFLMPKQGEIK